MWEGGGGGGGGGGGVGNVARGGEWLGSSLVQVSGVWRRGGSNETGAGDGVGDKGLGESG